MQKINVSITRVPGCVGGAKESSENMQLERTSHLCNGAARLVDCQNRAPTEKVEQITISNYRDLL